MVMARRPPSPPGLSLVLGWKMLGLERSLGTRIVTYADDLVILCRKGKAEEALQRLFSKAKDCPEAAHRRTRLGLIHQVELAGMHPNATVGAAVTRLCPAPRAVTAGLVEALYRPGVSLFAGPFFFLKQRRPPGGGLWRDGISVW